MIPPRNTDQLKALNDMLHTYSRDIDAANQRRDDDYALALDALNEQLATLGITPIRAIQFSALREAMIMQEGD